MPENTNQIEELQAETPPWEEDVSQRMELLMLGYDFQFHPSLEEVAEDYYQSKVAAKFSWWRWGFAGLVLFIFGILVFVLAARFLVNFGWTLPDELFHTLGFTNALGGLSDWAAYVMLLWFCLVIAFIFTTENKFLKRFYQYWVDEFKEWGQEYRYAKDRADRLSPMVSRKWAMKGRQMVAEELVVAIRERRGSGWMWLFLSPLISPVLAWTVFRKAFSHQPSKSYQNLRPSPLGSPPRKFTINRSGSKNKERSVVAPPAWAAQAKRHWKESRPRTYTALQKAGLLNHAVEAAVLLTREALDAKRAAGMNLQSAWKAVRGEFLFLPSEEDSPRLGENHLGLPQALFEELCEKSKAPK